MTGIPFPVKLRKYEFVIGLVYFPLHFLLLPVLLAVSYSFLSERGVALSSAAYDAIFYLVSFVVLALSLHKFLKGNFALSLEAGPKNLRFILLGYALYFLCSFAVAALIAIFWGTVQNPNNDTVTSSIASNLSASIASVVLLGPFVEECLFRGVLFNGIGSRSRWLGYAVSSLAFAFSHIYFPLLTDFDPALFITMLIYVPHGFALAWVYEKSGSIWNSVATHMAINATAVYLTYIS